MTKLFIKTISLAFVALLLAPLTSGADDFKRDVIYQIVTDRYVDGDTNNDNPPQSSGLFDPTKTDFQAYFGGDLAGVQQKMSYIAGMGVTAIWISPPIDNENKNEGGVPSAHPTTVIKAATSSAWRNTSETPPIPLRPSTI